MTNRFWCCKRLQLKSYCLIYILYLIWQKTHCSTFLGCGIFGFSLLSFPQNKRKIYKLRHLSLSQFVYFLREVCLLFNFWMIKFTIMSKKSIWYFHHSIFFSRFEGTRGEKNQIFHTYMSFDKFLISVVSRDLSQADKSIIRVSSFQK